MRGWRIIRDQLSEVGRVFRRMLGHPDLRSLQRRNARLETTLRSSMSRGYPSLNREINKEITATSQTPYSIDSLERFEAGCFSQNGEDGCLLEILRRTGFGDGCIVEIGCGAGLESNAALLICDFGWRGLLIDADEAQIEKARRFYTSEEVIDSVQLRQSMITPDSAQTLISEMLDGMKPDVISIDIDGWDYWVWKALADFRPAIFVVEVNASLGPEVSVTVPYEPSTAGHDSFRYEFRGWHHGASVKAMTALGKSRGYRLVHVESSGTNAFFVRTDLAGDAIKEVDPAEAWRPHQFRTRRHSAESQAATLAKTPLVEVLADGMPST